MTPSGREIQRCHLAELEGAPQSVKLDANGEFALISTKEKWVRIGNVPYLTSSLYKVAFDGHAKPQRLFENRIHLKWVLTQYPQRILATEIDGEQMAPAKPGEIRTKSWIFDLRKKTRKSISLPAGHFPVDLSADDSTLLTSAKIDGRYHTATTSLTTWKSEEHAGISSRPHAISKDGTQLFLIGNPSPKIVDDVINAKKSQLLIHDLKSGKPTELVLPAHCSATMAHTFGANGQHVVLVAYIWDRKKNPIRTSYQILRYNLDGNGIQLLFEANPGDIIVDIDWR